MTRQGRDPLVSRQPQVRAAGPRSAKPRPRRPEEQQQTAAPRDARPEGAGGGVEGQADGAGTLAAAAVAALTPEQRP